FCFFFSSRRRHTRFSRDWSSDVCSSDLDGSVGAPAVAHRLLAHAHTGARLVDMPRGVGGHAGGHPLAHRQDVLARGAHGADGLRDPAAQPRPGPRAAAGWTGFAVAGGDGDCGRWAVMAATSDKVALIRGPYRYGPYEYLYVNAQRIFACVHACEGIPTEALEAGVVRELIKAATRYLAATTR